MEKLQGDIWEIASYDDYIVVPTNEGWRKSNGENIMGAGLAKQAAEHYPGLPKWYGGVIKETIQKDDKLPGVILFPEARLIMFPVKPYNAHSPHLSWQGPASLALISKSCDQLARRFGSLPLQALRRSAAVESDPDPRILVPLVGCGNGKLPREIVEPVLEHCLGKAPFVLVTLA